MYPKVLISKNKITDNVVNLLNESNKRKVDLVAVTKVVANQPELVKILVDAGIKTIGDSRVINLKSYENLKVKKMQLRIPMISEVDGTVKYSDVGLVSEIETIKALNKAAKKINKIYNVILMIELGDIREGVLGYENILKTAKEIVKLSNIKFEGLGTNFACFGATIPTNEKIDELYGYKKDLEKDLNIKFETMSVGNSSHMSIWDDNKSNHDLLQMRCGAAIWLGIGLNDEPLEFQHQDAIQLQAEIIEKQIKPTTSWGPTGLNAFGKEIKFEDRGLRVKLIIAVGKQDVDFLNIIPIDKRLTVVGQSSDHTIIELNQSDSDAYKVGDVITFNLNYSAVMELFTSNYVKKEII